MKGKVIQIKSNKKEADDAKVPGQETAGHYETILKANPLDQKAYHRLMIIYRKQKDYKKELNVIKRGISSFEAFYSSHKKITGKKINSISMQLNKILGLTDKKGKMLYDQEPISTWKKRRDIVIKKIKSAS